MQTRMALQKEPEQHLNTFNKNLQNQSDSTKIVRKPNVRTTEYRKMMEIFLTDPDSVTREEFLLFQKAVGYSRALRLLNEGKRRKQLRKMGTTVTTLKQPLIEKYNETSDNAEQKVVQKKDPAIATQKSVGETVHMKKENENITSSGTGLPNALRSRLERLSGVDLSDINVHRNSDKPQQVGALAYTQGKDIHIASGQERHLPHEGWHAVQQKQERVEPTLQMKTGTFVNDNAGLEKEADIMGSRAAKEGSQIDTIHLRKISNIQQENKVIQRITQEEAMKLSKQNTHEKNKRNVENKDNSQTDDILDGIQTVLDVAGFVPGIGDIADGANTGIYIVRKDWLGAVLSGLAMIPLVGSAIAVPMKTIAKSVSKVGSKIGGISKTVKKAIELLVKLLGGAKKVISKLNGFLKDLKGILCKIPDLINKVADSKAVKWLTGKRAVKTILSFAKKIKNGIETVCNKADEVFTTVKNAVTKGAPNTAQGMLKKNGIPSTLSDEEIAAANAVDLQMSIKNTYTSIKKAPSYPEGFKAAQNGKKYVNMNNADLTPELREIESGKWYKVYYDGTVNGKKVSLHYFESQSGVVFNPKTKWGTWSNKSSR
jgi:hypothetical protein